jgi:dehydrogenase/reductase SDR family member 12
MITLQEKIQIARPIADCFRYLADFSTCEQWDPGVYRAEKVTPGAPAAGSEFDLILNSAGRRVPMRYRLLKLESPYRIELRGEGEGFSAHDIIRLRPLGHDRTEVDYQAELRFDGAIRHLEAVLNPLMVRMGRKAVSGLQRALTHETEVAPLRAAERLAYRTLLPAAMRFTERGYLAMPNRGLSDYLDGKRVVITGATAGLGLAAACELSRLGAEVIVVGRESLRLARAARQVRDFSGAAADKVRIVEAELSSLEEVRRVGEVLNRSYPHIDILINNAGALFAEHATTVDGHERALAINLLCPWLLTEQLLPALSRSRGRVINVASGGMYLQSLKLDDMQYLSEAYDGSKAYARAKRALTAVTEHQAAQHPEIFFSSMHPGWAATPGVAKSLPAFNQRMQRWLRDARMGADTMVWLASSRAPLSATGKFWFDRRPAPTAVLPGTEVSSQQRADLINWLETIL